MRSHMGSPVVTAMGALLFGVLPLSAAMAQFEPVTTWTGEIDNDFTNDANWTDGAPVDFMIEAIVAGGQNLPVVIPADYGELTIGAFQLGESGGSGGSIVQEGGMLILSSFGGDPKMNIGRSATEESSYIMNGGTILFDDPLGGAGAGLGSAGVNENDVEIGAAGGIGRFELHNDAVLRISDDFKIGAEADSVGTAIIDGNAILSTGSGISVSEAPGSEGTFIVGGNALVESGNSAGAGNTAQGRSDEGYFTLSSQDNPDNATMATVIFRDNAVVNVRSLQQRGSPTNFTIEDNAQFHIFDVFNGSGTETIVPSHMAQGAFSDFTITLQDQGVMTVDVNPGPAAAGLTMSSGRPGDNSGPGGNSRIEVFDMARLTIEQDLRMAVGNAETSNASLAKSSASTVEINGDLLMAVDDVGGALMGDGQTATLEFVLTSGSYSPIEVGGTAYLGNGHMSLVLDGYTPTGGEMFELLQAGTRSGEFLSVDTSQATLPGELMWEVSYTDTAVLLEVLGESSILIGDYSGNGLVEQADLDLVLGNWGAEAGNVPATWVNDLPEGFVDQAELDKVLGNWGASLQNAAGAVPEPATLALAGFAAMFLIFTSLSGSRRQRSCRTSP
jgi:hypothetical protein